MADHYCIASDHLRATVNTRGAELCRLQAGTGLELLWDGDPAVWGRTAPVLFPVVGALQGGRLVHQGQSYPMPRHGFARDMDFRLVRLSGHACTLSLGDDAVTRAMYPFPFRLDVGLRIEGAELPVQYELHNPGEADLPASFGAHPGFRWPLLPGMPREAHWLEFEKPESGPLPTLSPDGLLSASARANPLQGRMLHLDDGLFIRDALVFPSVQSRAVRYAAPGSVGLEVAWDGFPHLGVWSRPGAGFICIEPWRGFASPEGFDGEFTGKPGIFLVRPGDVVYARFGVKLLTPERV